VSGGKRWQKAALLVVVLLLVANQSGLLARFVPFVKVPIKDGWFVVIEETNDRPAWVANLVADADLWDQAKQLGIGHRFWDADSEDAKGYMKHVTDSGLPAYVFVNDGQVLKSGKLPDTREGVLKILNQES
jgi:hypothetical protein